MEYLLIPNPKKKNEVFFPRLELKETPHQYIISVDVAGIDEKDFHVNVKGNSLIIKGEKNHEQKQEQEGYLASEFYYGSFYRSVPLPDKVSHKMKTTYKNGIFFITIDKLKAQSKMKRKASRRVV